MLVFFLKALLHDFYPRPPRGGRLTFNTGTDITEPISIHALREEGDCISNSINILRTISIHALREEGDPGHWL